MNDFFRKHQDLITVSLLLFLTLFLLMANVNKKKSLNVFERGMMTALAPFQNSISWFVRSVTLVWDDYIHLVDVSAENRKLKKSADRLSFENTVLIERLKHFRRLANLLNFPGLYEISFEAATVIGRDTTGRVKALTINKGRDYGIEVNMPVVTYRGLVGRVVTVSGATSKVLLITDARSAIDALAQETRDGMVVKGANERWLTIMYLPVNANVSDGDRVISSGFGGIYPKGLLIGTLGNVRKSSQSLFLSARLRPSADLERIEEVLALRTPSHSARMSENAN